MGVLLMLPYLGTEAGGIEDSDLIGTAGPEGLIQRQQSSHGAGTHSQAGGLLCRVPQPPWSRDEGHKMISKGEKASLDGVETTLNVPSVTQDASEHHNATSKRMRGVRSQSFNPPKTPLPPCKHFLAANNWPPATLGHVLCWKKPKNPFFFSLEFSCS